MNERWEDIDHFYELIDALENRIGGKRTFNTLAEPWVIPKRGVYFFFEDGEKRGRSRERVVRVGTHGLTRNSKSSLWDRLKQHRGNTKSPEKWGGSRKSSVFRYEVGLAIIKKNGDTLPGWSFMGTKKTSNFQEIAEVENKVSRHIRNMPFLWIKIEDKVGPKSVRGYLERNSIALLSNCTQYSNEPKYVPSQRWLGRSSPTCCVRHSGLWNVKHVNENTEKNFLEKFEGYLKKVN